jgi:hypothetical protein
VVTPEAETEALLAVVIPAVALTWGLAVAATVVPAAPPVAVTTPLPRPAFAACDPPVAPSAVTMPLDAALGATPLAVVIPFPPWPETDVAAVPLAVVMPFEPWLEAAAVDVPLAVVMPFEDGPEEDVVVPVAVAKPFEPCACDEVVEPAAVVSGFEDGPAERVVAVAWVLLAVDAPFPEGVFDDVAVLAVLVADALPFPECCPDSCSCSATLPFPEWPSDSCSCSLTLPLPPAVVVACSWSSPFTGSAATPDCVWRSPCRTGPSFVPWACAICPQPMPLARSVSTPVSVVVVPWTLTVPPSSAAASCAPVGLVMPSWFSCACASARAMRTPPQPIGFVGGVIVVVVVGLAVPLPPAAVPVPVPVPAIQSAILPPLQQAFPAAGFPQNPPQILPLQSNTYAVSSPALFCGVDQAGTCQLMAQQLAQITPGWGTTVMNGPEGYGVYLTYQPV